MSMLVTANSPTAVSLKQVIIRHPLLAYFVLAFVGTWLATAPLSLGQDGSGLLAYHLPGWLYLLIYLFSAYTGPLLAAYVVIRAEGGTPAVRAWLRRFGQWRVGLQWYLVALFGLLVVWLVAYSLVYRGAPLLGIVQGGVALWSLFVGNLLIGIIVPGYGEEAGWRGFALPRLQARSGPLIASLVLGTLHGLWHLPVFFTPFLGPFTLAKFTAFLLTALAMTLIYTWMYNNTQGSILLAVLVHAAINATSAMLNAVVPTDIPLQGWLQPAVEDGWLNAFTLGLVALLLVIVTRGTLSYQAGANSTPEQS
jgi:membrane protease YdiL (CAAX protease family)